MRRRRQGARRDRTVALLTSLADPACHGVGSHRVARTLSTRVPRPAITAGEPASRQRRRTSQLPPWPARWPGRNLRLRPGTTIAIAVAASAHRGMGRGFLPRGLSNTCPQVSAMCRTVVSHGQVSNKPKQVPPIANEAAWARRPSQCRHGRLRVCWRRAQAAVAINSRRCLSI